MKNLFIFLTLLTSSFAAHAQNEPELIAEFSGGNTGTAFVLIADNTPKVHVRFPGYFDLYNTDFTLYKSIEIPAVVGSSYYVHFITLSMLDCDSTNLEYLVNADTGNPETQGVYVFREDGTQLFFQQGYRLNSVGSVSGDPTTSSIDSDSSGTYMVLVESNFNPGRRLYRFCGQLPLRCCTGSAGELLSGRPAGVVKEGNLQLYPNPTGSTLRIDYDLQGFRHAQAQVFTQSGTLVKEVRLGQGFSHFQLDVSGLANGVYIVRILTDTGAQLSQKFVKVGG